MLRTSYLRINSVYFQDTKYERQTLLINRAKHLSVTLIK